MEPIKIDEILQTTKGDLVCGNINQWIIKISTDSRQTTEGDLFIAIKGERFDGHNFIDEVIKKGACGIIISQDIKPDLSVTTIKVKDTLIALGKIAAAYRQKFNIPIIAVTGSNGKTTTKEMIGHLLSQKFNTLRSRSSFNNAIGLPMTLLELNNTTQSAVVEIGMNQIGEIKNLAQIAMPTMAIITNIGESHIGYLKTKENIAREKTQLLEVLPKEGIAILNNDDEYLSNIKFNGKLITYGIRRKSDMTAQNLYQDTNGIRFTINNTYELKIPILGLQNVYNALGAVVVACELGLNFDQIKDAFLDFKAPYGRMELSSYRDVKIINDAYNANPSSVKVALETLSQIPAKGRKILVMGDMLELGELSERFHRAIAKEIISHGVNILVTIGENAGWTAAESLKQGIEVYRCDSNDEIISKLKGMIKEGDVVLVKGSRRMKLEEVVEGLRPES